MMEVPRNPYAIGLVAHKGLDLVSRTLDRRLRVESGSATEKRHLPWVYSFGVSTFAPEFIF